MKKFVHLHNHSHYSILDGVAKIEELVKKTKECGFDAIAITEHGNLFSAMEFYKTCKLNDIKPIIGCEVYVAPKSRFEKDKDEKYYHLVLLAKDYEGYKNLIKISSKGYLEGFYYRPRVDKEVLAEYSKGLIALTACLGGEIPTLILEGDDEQKLLKEVDWYVSTFGRENFFFELQDHNIREEKIVNKKLIELSKKLNINVVATNDIHYIKKEDEILQHIIFAIRDKTTLNDPKLHKYPTNEFYYKSYEEMNEIFGEVPQSISNTILISEMCNLELKLNEKYTPNVKLPEGETASSYLKKLCLEGLNKRFPDGIPEEYQKRIEKELSLIDKMGFSNYFLIVRDFVSEAKSRGILVGPGRGSAAGALISYALGITEVDPIKYQLLFERFLNPERVSMPDIDVDFQDDRRDEVKEYIRTKYGYENTADIITFGVMKARASLKDVGRVLEIPLEKVNKITKLIDNKIANEPLDAVIEMIPELKILKENGTKQEREWIEYASRLDGTVRNISTHASGIIISGVPLLEIIPLYKDPNSGIIATQFEGGYLEECGLLKMDILGLSNLTIIQDTLRRIKDNHHITVDLNKIPLDDEKVFKLFSSGQTAGIFQFESQGMTEYLKQLKPTCIEDLIAMNALYRPGPMDNIPAYIARKHGKEKVDCYHKDFEPILKNTYGIIVYQEQVMQIAQVLSGFSLGKADVVRRIMAKKKPEELDKIRPEWINGAIERGYPRELAIKLFELLIPFSNYAFNKSHSAAYAILAYQIAYLKTYYKLEFMAALLTANMSDSDALRKYCAEAVADGIDILPPDINLSMWEFLEKYENGKSYIIFGFGGIKGLGETFSREIINERNTGGKFSSFEDFLKRMRKNEEFKKTYAEVLIKAGAFDNLVDNSSLMAEKSRWLSDLEDIIEHHQNVEKYEKKGAQFLFHTDEVFLPKPSNVCSQKLSTRDEFLNEISVFGFYLSRKFFKECETKFGKLFSISKDVLEKIGEVNLFTWGFIAEAVIKINSGKNNYALITFDNGKDIYKFTIFSDKYEKFKSNIVAHNFIILRARTKKNNNQTVYDVLDIKPIEYLREERFTEFHICIKDNNDNEPMYIYRELENLKEWLTKPEIKGNWRIYFHITGKRNITIRASDRFGIKYSEPFINKLTSLDFVTGYWIY